MRVCAYILVKVSIKEIEEGTDFFFNKLIVSFLFFFLLGEQLKRDLMLVKSTAPHGVISSPLWADFYRKDNCVDIKSRCQNHNFLISLTDTKILLRYSL